MNTAEHESLCTRCGTSCLFAIDVDDVPIVIPELRCRFLKRDGDGRHLCSVYEDRFERAPWCETALDALKEGLLGQECGYVRALGPRDYVGKRRLTAEQRKTLLPILREALIEHGAPVGASPEGLRELLKATGGGDYDLVETEDALEFVER